MKKVVNSVLASALALTVAPMVVGAEEAATAPQMDPGLEKVVKRLEALKLIQGYGNGDYGVERSITRAEFATLIVRAKGLEEGAKLAQFQSNFTDVKPSDWFAGYVNVASGQEIVKGYQDQSFRGGNNVTYAEAVTMIVRSLGYDPAVKGVWPNSHIAKASELGISQGVKVTPDKPATRGDIMIMLDNALTVGLMKQIEYGTDIRFEIYDGKNGNEKKTLLTEYLNVDVYDMDWANDGGNKNRELPFVTNTPITGLGTLKVNEVSFSGGLKGTYKVADGINVNGFGGQHVQVWVKDDREDYVVWMENSDDEEVLNVRMDTVYYNDKIIGDSSKVDKLENLEFKFDNDKTYELAKNSKGDVDVKVTFNFQTYSKSEKGIKDIIDAFADSYALSAKVVLNDDGDISYINVVDDVTADKNVSGVKYGSEVIEKIDANKQKIENLEDGSFTELKDKEEGKDFLVYLNGKAAKFADLQPMDVYSVYYPQGKKDRFVILATRTVVEGKVDKVDARKDYDNRLVIGDKTYRVRNTSYSENANKDVEKPTGEDLRDKLRDLDGVEVKLYLDASGRVRHIETKDNVNDRRFDAIITKDVTYDNSNDKYSFTAYTEKGTKQVVSLEREDIEWGYTVPGKFKAGDELTDAEIEATLKTIGKGKKAEDLRLVEITLNSKGEVDKVKVLNTSDLTVNKLEGAAWDKAADEDGLVLNVTEDGKKKSYDVTDSTVVFDMTGEIEGKRNELTDVRLAKFKAVADEDDVTVYYLTDEGDLDYVFVVAGDSVEDATEYGLVKTFPKAGDDTVTIIKKDGEDFKEVTYKLDGDVKDAQERFNRYDFVRYSVNGDNEVIIDDVEPIVEGYWENEVPSEVVVNPDMKKADLDDVRTGKVTKVDGNKITVMYLDDKGEKQKETLLTSNSTLYISSPDLESIGSVSEDDYVVLVETDDDDSRFDYVVKVTDQDEIDDHSEKKADGTIVYDEGYDMKNFLGYSGDVVEPGPDLIDNDSVEAVEEPFFGSTKNSTYTVSGQLNKDFYDAEVVVTFDGKDYEVPAGDIDNGAFDYLIGDVPFAAGIKEYTLTVTKGDKKEVVKGTFTKK